MSEVWFVHILVATMVPILIKNLIRVLHFRKRFIFNIVILIFLETNCIFRNGNKLRLGLEFFCLFQPNFRCLRRNFGFLKIVENVKIIKVTYESVLKVQIFIFSQTEDFFVNIMKADACRSLWFVCVLITKPMQYFKNSRKTNSQKWILEKNFFQREKFQRFF